MRFGKRMFDDRFGKRMFDDRFGKRMFDDRFGKRMMDEDRFGKHQRSLLVPLNSFKNLMFFTFLCLNKSNISQKSQIGLAEMSPIAKSGNSMLMICFDLNKTELPDLAIKGIPICPI